MYEIFEHTADVGIRVRAKNLDELFADAARGLFSLIVANPDAVRMVEETTLQLEGDDLEELLHDWLSELLYVFNVRRLAPADFLVHVGPAGLSATVRGEPIDLNRHHLDSEVKAITWHALRVERNADGWLAEVVVDV